MEDFNSKYTGEQVEALLDIVAEGGSGGGGEGEVQKTTEAEITAMGFTKNLGTITEVKMNGTSKGTSGVVDLGNVPTQESVGDLQDLVEDLSSEVGKLTQDKVDKVDGKQLSTEDFTTVLKNKLDGLNNYDDTELAESLSTLRADFDKLVSGDTTTAIKTFNEIIAFLDGIQDSQDLSSIIASIEQQIAGKQDTISDLATIRSGAAKGATALQSYTEKYKGTVTGVKLNGTTYSPSNGVVDLGTISGGDGGGNSAYPIVEIGIEPNASQTVTLQPNTYYILRGVGISGSGDVTIELAPPENTAIANEYVCLFEYWDGLPVIMPFVVWANDEAPVINSITEISIVGGYGVWCIYE